MRSNSIKNFLFCAIAFFGMQMIFSQESPEVSDQNLYNTAGLDVKPQFPGGIEEFYKFVGQNYKAPKVQGLKGKVYVTFIIEIDGSITDVKIIRDIGYGSGEEAVRVLKNSPRWLPGEQNGRKVRVLYSLPITIQT